MQDYTISETLQAITISTPALELAFSREDGGLRLLRRAGGPNLLGHGAPCPGLDVQAGLDAVWLSARTPVRYLRSSVVPDGDEIVVEIATGIGPLIVTDRLRIAGERIVRTARVRNVGEDEVLLHAVRLALPWVRPGPLELCRFEAPGNHVRPRVALAVAAAQRRDVLPRRFFAPGLRDGRALEPAPTMAPGLLAAREAETGETLLCWFGGERALARPFVEGNDQAVTLGHEVELAARLPGDQLEQWVESEPQHILLLRAPWPEALAAYRTSRPPAPQPRPGWLRDATLYEAHPAGCGGFRGLAGTLDSLRALGITTLCLLPVWSCDNRSGAPWGGETASAANPYAVLDYGALDAALGTPDDLRALVQAAHSRGMRVIADLPLIGCAPAARYVAEHPTWICRDAAGQPLLDEDTGAYRFDWSDPALQDYLLATMCGWLHDMELDGFRAVPARRPAPNWAHGLSRPAGAGALALLPLLERLRAAMAATRSEAALVSAHGGPAYAARTDLACDELPHHLFFHMAFNRVTPLELGEWLQDHLGALPPGVARACWVENHQTRILNPLADGLRGSRLSRMLFAGMVFAGFVPLVAAGQEECDAAQIAQLLAARAASPALRHGAVHYNAIACDSPQIFAVLRVAGDERVVGALNVSAHQRQVTLRLPAGLLPADPGALALYDLLGNDAGGQLRAAETGATLHLTLAPFAACCFQIALAPHDPARQPADRQVDALSHLPA